MPAAAKAVADSHRRISDRIPTAFDVEYRGSFGSIMGKAINISKGGMFVESPFPLLDGETTFFKIVIPGCPMHFHVEARVMWGQRRRKSRHRPPKGMGLSFVRSTSQNEKTIEGILSIVNGLKSPIVG